MANDTAYQYGKALLPTKFNICGVSLKPLCLGHILLLEEINNPLANPETISLGLQEVIFYLFQALLICSMSYEDAVSVLENDDKQAELFELFSINLMENMKIEEDWNIHSKLTLFKSYISYFMDMPLYTEENSSGDIPTGTDWKQNIFLIFKKLGYNQSEIINMNMKKLFYEWCSYAEGEGAIKVLSRHDVEMLKNLK